MVNNFSFNYTIEGEPDAPWLVFSNSLATNLSLSLFIVGAQDGTLPSKMREMHPQVYGSALIELDRAGHLSNIERPEAFNRALQNFLPVREHFGSHSPYDRLSNRRSLYMPRITLPSSSSMSESQQRVYDEIARGCREHTPAPLQALLRSPELASRAEKLGEFVRYGTSLSPRLSELAILVSVRYWTAQYGWSIHKREALKAGLDPAIINDVAARQRPHFNHPDERVVYDFAAALHESHQVSDDVYRMAVEMLSEQGVVELVGLLGYYTLMSMTLNVFEIDVPEGERAELAP